MTRVSIIMPAFNSERFIGAALQSIAAQTARDFEVLVVDDGSTDETAAIVDAVARHDDRFRRLPGRHAGVAVARNRGLAAAKGSVISFLDSDDLWPPDRLQRHLDRLDDCEDMAAVVGEILIFEALGDDFEPAPGSAHFRALGISLCAATIRRRAFDELGPFDDALDYAEDLDFLMRLHESGLGMLIEPDLALLHRRHESNMTLDEVKSRRFMLIALQKSLARRRAPGFVPPSVPFPIKNRDDLVNMRPRSIGPRPTRSQRGLAP